jgi:hypothetical protein
MRDYLQAIGLALEITTSKASHLQCARVAVDEWSTVSALGPLQRSGCSTERYLREHQRRGKVARRIPLANAAGPPTPRIHRRLRI